MIKLHEYTESVRCSMNVVPTIHTDKVNFILAYIANCHNKVLKRKAQEYLIKVKSENKTHLN